MLKGLLAMAASTIVAGTAFGQSARGIHVTVDDAPWHWADASGETVVVVGLLPGPHKVLIELADPTRKVITSQTVSFMMPDPQSRARQ
jgi:hypothetical protein